MTLTASVPASRYIVANTAPVDTLSLAAIPRPKVDLRHAVQHLLRLEPELRATRS